MVTDSQVRVVDGPNVIAWPATATLTKIEFLPNDFRVEFTKQDGPGRWPDFIPPGWDGPIQYTLWPVVQVDGEWRTVGAIEFWHGRPGVGGPFSKAAQDWWFRTSAMGTHQPQPGETVGFFVAAGDQRLKDVRSVEERSDIVYVQVPANDSATYTFAQAAPPAPVPTPAPAPAPVADPALPVAIDALRLEIAQLRAAVLALTDKPAPSYGGTFLGYRVALKPQP